MILDNPFHVLGLPADATTKELNRRKGEIKARLRVGQPLVFVEDLYFPPCRRHQAAVERAISDLQDAGQRIQYGLFWFTRSGILDHHAQRLITKGDLVQALELLARIESRPVTAAYASSLNNLGTVCLLLALAPRTAPASTRADLLHRGLRAKARLIGLLPEQDFTDFCKRLGDELAARSNEGIVEAFGQSLGRFLEEAKKYGVPTELRRVVGGLDAGGPRCGSLKGALGSTARQNLERSIGACAASYASDPSRAYQAAQDLMRATPDDLANLAASTSPEDFSYVSVADSAAEELLDAAVTAFNHQAESGALSLRLVAESRTIVQYAAEIACSEATRKRARDDLDSLVTIEQHLRTAEVGNAVAKAIADWLERARVATERMPEGQIAFVHDALTGASEPDASVLDLLEAVRSHGAATHGPTHSWSEEMVTLNSVVCHHLLSLIIAAHNVSGGRVGEADDIRRLKVFFVPVSDARSRSVTVFPVDAECARRLDSNLELARRSSLDTQGRAGCALFVVVAVLIFLGAWCADAATVRALGLEEPRPAAVAARNGSKENRQPARSVPSRQQEANTGVTAEADSELQQRVLELEAGLRAAADRIRELEEARESDAEAQRRLETELARERSDRETLSERTAADTRALGERVEAVRGEMTDSLGTLRTELADQQGLLAEERQRRAVGDRRGVWYVVLAGGLSLLAVGVVWGWNRRESERLRESGSRFRESVRDLLSLKVKAIENLVSRLREAEEPADAEPHHGLVLEVCNEVQRIENNLRQMDSSVRGHKKLMGAVRRVKANLRVREYEITDLHGVKYDPRMTVSAKDWTTDDSLRPGAMVISWVMIPEVRFRGRIIQAGEVRVAQGQ